MQEAISHNRVYDFISAVDRTESIDDAWSLTTGFMYEFGASQVGIKSRLNSSKPLFLWTVPLWVTQMYLETVYPENDPRLEHCRTETTPYFYGREFWQKNEAVPAPRRQYDEEITSASMRSLVSIPVHGRSVCSSGIFAFASGIKKNEFRKMYSEHGAQIHLAGLAAFNHINQLSQKKTADTVGITCRERECLLWLSRGLRNDQIAERLGVRRVTIEFHLANARHKLDAVTREQALVRAVQLNIIDP